MKCIYCNAEKDFTVSDIITFAITGAKLKKSFVCKRHNAYTNDNYEKEFVAGLDFFRSHLGLTTRNGQLIKYNVDLTVDGTKIHDITFSNKESLYAPKGILTGTDDNGNKIRMGPISRLEKISRESVIPVDTSSVVLHKTISSEDFLGFNAIHSIAKIAYEWYCFINDIEEYKEDYSDIVEYILGKKEGDFVDIIIDGNYYHAIDCLSEIGTNSIFQYDDGGFRYVVFDLWDVISYRVRICKLPNNDNSPTTYLFSVYLYHIDGTKTNNHFSVFNIDNSEKTLFRFVEPQNIDAKLWSAFSKRLERIITTTVFTIGVLKKNVDLLTSKLKKYDDKKIDLAMLLGYEEDDVLSTIQLISQLHDSIDKYDRKTSFNENVKAILQLDADIITITEGKKSDLLRMLESLDETNQLSGYMWKAINTFNDIYQNETRLLDLE